MSGRLSCWLVDRYADVYVLFNPVTPLDTGPVTDTVYAVKTGQVNFFIYRKGDDAVCIDSGFGRSVIRRELGRLGIRPDSISHVLLTHSDFDHAGGLSLFPTAQVFLSEAEEQMVDGTRARALGIVRNRLSCEKYTLLADGETLTVGEIGIRAIWTPGHTPGSMSYLVDGRYLFTGDAFRIIDGRVRPIRPFLTMNPTDGDASIKKLARLSGVEAVFTAHRGWAQNFNEIMGDYRE